MSELYQDKMDRGETLVGKAGLSLLDKPPHLSCSPLTLPSGMSVQAAMGCHPASDWAVKQQLLLMEGSQGLLKDVTNCGFSCGYDHLGLPKVTGTVACLHSLIPALALTSEVGGKGSDPKPQTC